jgi:hypothetical protein
VDICNNIDCFGLRIVRSTSYYTLPDVLLTIRNPKQSMLLHISTWVPSYLSFSIHLYHIIDERNNIRLEDLKHHVIFVGIFGMFNFALI